MPLVVGGTVNAPPFAPIPISPTNGEAADLAPGPTFAWTFQAGTPGAAQTAWYFRRKVAGASSFSWWNVSTGAWQSTEVANTGTAQDYTFAAGKWTDGVTYNWSVATADANGKGPYCATSTVVGQHGPTVLVTAPGGTIATSRPTVQWTSTVALRTTQTSYRVAIYDAAQYGAVGFVPFTSTAVYDSGLVYGTSTTLTPPMAIQLENGTTYRAYVEITETGGMTSPVAFSAFTTSFTAPALPTVTVTTQATPTTTKPVNTIVVVGHDTAPLVGHTLATVRFSDDGGVSWWPVRTGTLVPIPATGQTVTVLDKEAPFGYQRHYRVTVVKENPTVVSTPVVASVTTAASLLWHLSDPLTGAAVALHLAPGNLPAVATDRQQKYPILGRPDPVILSDSFELPNLTLQLVFLTNAAYQKFEAMRSTQHIFLLQGPHPAGQWYVRLGKTKTDETNLPSLRNWGSTGAVVRTIKVTAQAVAAP